MNLIKLWCMGVVSPRQAFAELNNKSAPQWGFWIVFVFNLLISFTTLLAQYLMHQTLVMPSVLTFLPDEKYLPAEMFFLPPLRVLVWILGAGIIHLGLRLIGHPGGIDQILNIGGLGYLIIMPFILITDWVLVAVDRYQIAEYTHSLITPWAIFLSTLGLKQLLDVKTRTALILVLVSELLTIPILAIFAR